MIRIISDSTCDLSPELVQRYDISILPLHILLGEEEYEDGSGIGPDEIYRWSDEHRMTPKTSAPSLDRTIELMRPILENGDEIICFSISESMSTSGNVMRLAAEELEAEDRVSVIDSANLSTGIGLLVIEAAIMAAEGKKRDEIISRIEELKPLVRSSFVVDTMVYLQRGGRCSSITALAGTALKIHPEIMVKDGSMIPGKKYRGKMGHVIEKYVKDLEEELVQAKNDRVFITHSGCREEIIQAIKKYLEELNVFKEILITRAGSVISSHCGPGTLGVLFIAKERS